jgi:uncharacterized protein YbbC (DUF1343 family)/CubicO group peptidase (beta-lactamase class C family)
VAHRRTWWTLIALLPLAGCAPSVQPAAAPGAQSAAAGRNASKQAAPAERVAAPVAAAEQQPSAAITGAGKTESEAAPEIDKLIGEAIAAHATPGCVVAVGDRERVRFARAYGQRAIVPAPEAMTDDTIFDLASLTKPLATASAIMRLVDDGKLRLDDPASRYLKELRRPETRAISVRQLLLHAAGLPHVNALTEYDGGAQRALAAALRVAPEARAGEHFLYSDVGYIWLGELVKRVAGEPLDAFTRSTLYEPLGMRDTRYAPGAELLPRIAPTEITDLRGPAPVLIHGVVHDPRAYRLGGVAGHAGLFSTAHDVARFARMLLNGGALDGTRVLSETAVAEMTRSARVGDSARALGWDVRSEYSRLRGTLMSDRSFGHGGYTGTSLWIDPRLDLFVVLLSNRVHPDGKGNVIGLAGAVADAAVRAFGHRDATCALPQGRVLPGIDVLREQGYAALAGQKVGLVTHLAARSADGPTTLDLIAHAPGVTLAAIFSPEHGLEGKREGVIADGRDKTAGVPVFSLFGPTRRPSAEMLQGIDVLVVDLVDVGTRFYTYMSTLHEVLRAAGERHLKVVVLDRPNPLGGVAVEGPVLDDSVHTFVNHYALPVRHGLTAGELAALINREEQLGVDLKIVEARNWRRELTFARSGLAWTAPSPNLKSAQAALLYPSVGLLESSNLSVGRGTDRAFEQFGAPWLNAAGVVAALRQAQLPGVRFAAIEFTPASDRYAHERCHGVRLQVSDAGAFKPVRTALEVARALLALHRGEWEAEKLQKLLGSAESMRGLLAGENVAELERGWEPGLARYRARRSGVLRYPSCE